MGILFHWVIVGRLGSLLFFWEKVGLLLGVLG